MKPLWDYIILEEVKPSEDAVTHFKAEGDESPIGVGKIVDVSDSQDSNNELGFDEEDIGRKVLFKRHSFQEFEGKLIGEVKNIIAEEKNES